MGWMNTLLEGIDAAAKMKQSYDSGKLVMQLMELDRDSGLHVLEHHINQLNEASFDVFEAAFLNASSCLATPGQRIRAMELYTWVKMLETQRFGRWRGFVNWS